MKEFSLSRFLTEVGKLLSKATVYRFYRKINHLTSLSIFLRCNHTSSSAINHDGGTFLRALETQTLVTKLLVHPLRTELQVHPIQHKQGLLSRHLASQQELLSGTNKLHMFPIVEQSPCQSLNDSKSIAELLNEKFPARYLRKVSEVREYDCLGDAKHLGPTLVSWVVNDVYENALDKNDGSRGFFTVTRESKFGCELEDVLELYGGEHVALHQLRVIWTNLRSRMVREDGNGERESFFIFKY